MDQNTELLASFNRCEPRHRLSENQKMQISSEESLLSLAFFTVPTFITLGLAPLRCLVCVASKRKQVFEKRCKRGKPLLETVRSFNSSRGVIQCLNIRGRIIPLTSSCFCLPSSPRALFCDYKALEDIKLYFQYVPI